VEGDDDPVFGGPRPEGLQGLPVRLDHLREEGTIGIVRELHGGPDVWNGSVGEIAKMVAVGRAWRLWYLCRAFANDVRRTPSFPQWIQMAVDCMEPSSLIVLNTTVPAVRRSRCDSGTVSPSVMRFVLRLLTVRSMTRAR
jgi:hypothetical protein